VCFRSVPLNPTPDGGVIYGQAALRHQLLQIRQTQGNLRYQRTQVAIMIGSNCRFRNNAGRRGLMPPTYQMWRCNTSLDELYTKSSVELKKLAKEINQRKGLARKC
jgi:hypothetical protein